MEDVASFFLPLLILSHWNSAPQISLPRNLSVNDCEEAPVDFWRLGSPYLASEKVILTEAPPPCTLDSERQQKRSTEVRLWGKCLEAGALQCNCIPEIWRARLWHLMRGTRISTSHALIWTVDGVETNTKGMGAFQKTVPSNICLFGWVGDVPSKWELTKAAVTRVFTL